VTALLEAHSVSKEFAVRRGLLQGNAGFLKAVEDVDLQVHEGDCLALVGESGSGKTTLGRCLIGLERPTSGSVSFQGDDLMSLPRAELRKRRREFQMVFQDPYGSLNPRMRVGRILAEPLAVHSIGKKIERGERVARLLEMVGLPPEAAERFPHEFSGGQRQRIGIARALATEPALVIADEPVSALDVSVQAQIINLLLALRRELGLTLIVIAHDLAMVQLAATRVAVMYMGRIVEEGSTSKVFGSPEHPYTRSLLEAVPVPDPARKARRTSIEGELPSPMNPPAGCAFHPRCPIAIDRCRSDRPELEASQVTNHRVACHLPGNTDASGSGTFQPE